MLVGGGGWWRQKGGRKSKDKTETRNNTVKAE